MDACSNAQAALLTQPADSTAMSRVHAAGMNGRSAAATSVLEFKHICQSYRFQVLFAGGQEPAAATHGKPTDPMVFPPAALSAF